MAVVLYLVVTAGLVMSCVLLALALVKRRVAPQHRAPWILALVVLGIDALLHVVASTAMLVAGEGEVLEWAWFLIGTLGFLAIVAVAVLRPRWAGWGLLASAAVVPLVFAVSGLAAPSVTGPSESDAAPPWPVAMVAYSLPATISGALLVLSTTTRRRSTREVTSGAVPLSVR